MNFLQQFGDLIRRKAQLKLDLEKLDTDMKKMAVMKNYLESQKSTMSDYEYAIAYIEMERRFQVVQTSQQELFMRKKSLLKRTEYLQEQFKSLSEEKDTDSN